MSRHDEMPVLPDEATSLPIHVAACAQRYVALLNRLVRVERIVIGGVVVMLAADKGGPALKWLAAVL